MHNSLLNKAASPSLKAGVEADAYSSSNSTYGTYGQNEDDDLFPKNKSTA